MDQTETNQQTNRAAWGDGRIVFAAHAKRIQDYMAQGWPLKKIYRELESQLTGLSYQQFAYHVRKQNKATKPSAMSGMTSDMAANTENQVHQTMRGQEDEQKQEPSRSGKPGRFIPGPRVPDPSQLY